MIKIKLKYESVSLTLQTFGRFWKIIQINLNNLGKSLIMYQFFQIVQLSQIMDPPAEIGLLSWVTLVLANRDSVEYASFTDCSFLFYLLSYLIDCLPLHNHGP